ncbi:hypothetical protein DNTS_011103 [Danionella cerebrum]|uniref:SH3 domain-containing protein n=1 Tax=Danionella cerebrum TaxID=2873325 RepID=A0A553RKL5_9TELE|nr:hypothetical protein DNTS_011103 [Danionella translucida]
MPCKTDYKLCGDPECESMLCRVQAQRDHVSEDCLFLNFKKGEMITVYFKLTGKRNDLWGGSIEKLSGLFPKDAIKIDQHFTDEKKEIQVATQEFDFICFDENGSVIKRSTEFDHREDSTHRTQETMDMDLNQVHHEAKDSEENELRQTSLEDVSDSNSPKSTEQGGSSWIGSTVSGWFDRNEQSNTEPQDRSTEESFKSRKIVMDIEVEDVEDESDTGTFGWIRGELNSAFGFGNKDVKADSQDNIENLSNHKEALPEDSNTHLTEKKTEKEEEITDMRDQIVLKSQQIDLVDNRQEDNDNNENFDGITSENEQIEEDKGWYENVYNSFTRLYGEEHTKPEENDEGQEGLSNKGSFDSNIDNIGNKESDSGSQILFSVSGFTSVLSLPFQTESVEKTANKENPGKKDISEAHSNEDLEEEALLDIAEQDTAPKDPEGLVETQLLADQTSDVSEDSLKTEELDDNSEERMAYYTFLDSFTEVENKPKDFVHLEKPGKADVQIDEVEEENIVEEDDSETRNADVSEENKIVDSSATNTGEPGNRTIDLFKDIYDPDTTEKLDESAVPQFLNRKSADNLIKVLNEINPDDFVNDETEEQNDELKEENIGNKNVIEKKNEEDGEDEMSTHVNIQDSTIVTEVGAIPISTIKDPVEMDNTKPMNEKSNNENTNSEIIENKYSGHLNYVKSYFLEQLKVITEKISDSDGLNSSSKAIDSISDTLGLIDEALKDSTRESNIQNDNESVNNSIDDIIKNKFKLTDVIPEGQLTQDYFDPIPQFPQQETDSDEITRDNVIDESKQFNLREKIVSYLNTISYTDTANIKLSVDAEVKSELTEKCADEHKKEDKGQRKFEPTLDKNDPNGNVKLVMEINDRFTVERNELITSSKDELIVKEDSNVDINDKINRNKEFVIDRDMAQLEKEGHQEEKLSDLEADETEKSKEHKVSTDINHPAGEESCIHTLGTNELALITEESSHPDLKLAPNPTEEEFDGERGFQDVLNIIPEAGLVSEDGKVFVAHEVLENPPILNDTLTPQSVTDVGGCDVEGLEDRCHDLGLTEIADIVSSNDYTSSKGTKLTSPFSSEKNTLQGDEANLLLDKTDTVNNEDFHSGVPKWEESDLGTIPIEHSADLRMQSPNRENPDNISNFKEALKVYKNLSPHLSRNNIQELLDLFGDHWLSWLNSQMNNTSAGQDYQEELHELEELLEYYMMMNTRPVQQETSPGKDGEECPALQKLFTLFSALKAKHSSENTNTNVESKEETAISTKYVQNDQVKSNTNDLAKEPVSEEKGLSTNRDDLEDLRAEEIRKDEDRTYSKNTKISPKHDQLSVELVDSQNGGFQFHNIAVFVEVTRIVSLLNRVVSSLPDDIRPGPDLYGLPWEAVVFTGVLGLFTLLLFTCRFIHSIKSRLYASKEKQLAHEVAELLNEKCKVLETLGEVKHKFDELESTLQNNGMSARTAEKDCLEEASEKLEQSNAQIKKQIERLEDELLQQSQERKQQEDELAELEQVLLNLEEEAKERKSQLEQDNTTLKIHEINTERLQRNLLAAKEEHSMLLESKEQLLQESEGWGERLSELEEEMKMCERSHAGMLEDCAIKDDRIKSLTECLLKMREWDPEGESNFHQKQKVQKLIEAAKMSADLKSMEEDKSRVFAKLADEMKAKEDLQEGIKQLEDQKEVLASESAKYSSESQKLQQKLQIMTEMYQENELKLHRMLTVEEKERLQKEEKLNKAGKKISLAAEELNTYRQRAKDLEEELERTSQAFKNQIAAHEKKAHDNWLAARAADRDLADVKRENANLRQRSDLVCILHLTKKLYV